MPTLCTVCGHEHDTQHAAGVCAQCGAKLVSTPSRVTDTGKRSGKRLARPVVKAFVALVVLAGLYSYYRDAFRDYHPVIAKQPEITSPGESGRINSSVIEARIEGPLLIVSLSEVRDKRVVRFYDPENIQDIPVLAYVTPAGRLVTAMSISETCHSRDFYLEGENIHCANCPSYWNASSLEAYACCQKYYPFPIPSTILGDELRVAIEDIRSWQARS